MKVVLISDTHGEHRKVDVPKGDLLIHAGDSMSDGWDWGELRDFIQWFEEQEHRHKILIAGNHDWLFEKYLVSIKELCKAADIHYLLDESISIGKLKIYGSPWQPEFYGWAFNLPRGKQLAEKWARIPDDVDILVTHGPPYGKRDWVHPVRRPQNLGCLDLANRLDSIHPIIHVFGHIHGGYGITEGSTTFVNASIMDEAYRPVNAPTVVTIKAIQKTDGYSE